MKTAKLHELIEMAKAGKKFTALSEIYGKVDQSYFTSGTWSHDAVARDWQYEDGPQIIFVNSYPSGNLHAHKTKELAEKNASHAFDGAKIARKFIEVME